MKVIHVGEKYPFQSIKAALEYIDEPTYIYLEDDYFFEQVLINKNNIIIDGKRKKATIEFNAYSKNNDNESLIDASTLIIKGKNIQLRNLIIINNYDLINNQELVYSPALSLLNDNIVINNTTISGGNSTLLLLNSLNKDSNNDENFQYFYNSYFKGKDEIIRGNSSADFLDCTFESLKTKNYSSIVNPLHLKNDEHGFNFINSKFINDEKVKENSVYLAKSIENKDGLVRFINCYLDHHIKNEGFLSLNKLDYEPRRYYEINSYGSGANKKERVLWAKIIRE